jgi:hypothetical protein
MPRRQCTFLLTFWLALVGLADIVLAQRAPPSAPTDRSLSLSAVWEWFVARPGVMIAVGVIVVMFLYLFLTRKKPEATDANGGRRD